MCNEDILVEKEMADTYEGQTSQVDISIIAQPFLGPRELLELFSLEKCKKIKVR